MAIGNILRPFGIIYSHFGIVSGHLVNFFRFGMFGPVKIWQPWAEATSGRSTPPPPVWMFMMFFI
jgi:hypothetical protein